MKNNDIQYLLRKIVNPIQPNDNKVCIVRVYDSTTKTVTVEPINDYDFDEATPNVDNYIYGVKLSAFQPQEEDTFGILYLPKIDSYVIVSTIENSGYFISMYSQIDRLQIYTEGNCAITMHDTNLMNMADQILLVSNSSTEYQIALDYENKVINILTSDGDINLVNDKAGISLYGSNGNIGIANDKSGINLAGATGEITIVNDMGTVGIDATGLISIKNSTFSLKKDILTKIQLVLTSMDGALNGLGVTDPTRTANITLLKTAIPLLLKD